MLSLTKRFPLKRAFITGAGSGLGKSLALQLADDGWTVGITDINEAALNETAKAVNQKGKAIAFVQNVADENAYKTIAETFLKQTGGIDILVNNAGVGDGAIFGEYELQNWQWIVGINQMGVIYGCHFFVPVMKQQGSGHIINVASAAAFAAAATMSPYNVTKAAVLSLSETLFAELKHEGVDVSVVMPTFFRTNIMQYGRGTHDAKKFGEKLVAKARLGSDEIAAMILKAAGNKNFYIVLPKRAKVLFVIKRLFPSLFLRFTAYVFKNRDKLKR